MRPLAFSCVLLICLACALPNHRATPPGDDRLARIQLPPGFQISLYADQVPNARSLVLTPGGTLFVSTRSEGAVYAVRDEDGDGRGETVHTLATDLNMPNGAAFRNGALYVAETTRILRYDGIEARLSDPPEPVVVYDQLPDHGHHGWRYIGFGPDDKLYVSVGAPCNICERETPYATILRMNLDGTGLEVFAHGVRNSVGFAWHPTTGELWFTDNGRDMLGDDVPPCELNRAVQAGQHFGYPYVHGGDILDPEFGTGRRAADYTPPAQRLGAHVAPLGIAFYTGTMFPAAYRHQLFIAEHGSWNRSQKSGYRLTLVTLDDTGKALRYEPFATGWLQGEENWGRPVDLELMPDGSLLVSDDQSGAIYRITYTG